MFYAILAVALVLLDQFTKFLVRANIPLGGDVPFLPGFLGLTYVQNTGAAFSLLQEHTWLLTLTSAAVVLFVCWLVVKGTFRNPLGRVAACLVLAGGVGNLIDRVIFGFVTDMIETQFMTFPVFNVADCCITVGAPLLFVYLAVYWLREEKKEGESHDGPGELPPDGR